ncbi:uncharacterized protein LOC111412981 isoform X1 [Olea europaea var. sylvestris]|uniref:uncharacterized protein LOC111412981 isoform X1 n=1 Tax=Olea europaea var. sylvestris TaxID=158386 RepID=UPI000C1CFA54|nr:uncharacterized protein LOC111412981 isoform X1 [Olea europaea var. sylvestris]
MAVSSSNSLWAMASPNSSFFSSRNPFISNCSSHSCSSLRSCFYFKQNSLNCSNQNSPSYSPNSVADKVLTDIQNSGIIACLRAQSAEIAIEAARAALHGGISVLEVVMSNPGVLEVLKCLVQEYPSKSIGVGTVLDGRDAKDAMKSGAKFLMSPATVKDILDDVTRGQALYIPGVMTPTEILFAFNAGAKLVKVYPVSALGGVQYIAALRKPFPHIPMVASQGITIDSIGEYISQGASSVVLSDAIFNKKALDQLNFDTIYQLAHLAALRGNEAIQRKKRGSSA